MEAVKIPDLSELAIIPDRHGKPEMVFVPIAVWDELPSELRDRLMAVKIAVRGKERLFAALPWRIYDEIKDEIEDASDAIAFDTAAAAFRRETQLVAEMRAEAGIPIEVSRMLANGFPPIMAWRKYRGLRQVDLATRAGVERSYIAHLEGRKRRGAADTIARIAQALGCPIEDLTPHIDAPR